MISTYVAAVVAGEVEGELDGLLDDEEKEMQQRVAAGLELEGPGGHGATRAALNLPELDEGGDVFLKRRPGEAGRVAAGAEHFELEHLLPSLPLAEAAQV